MNWAPLVVLLFALGGCARLQTVTEVLVRCQLYQQIFGEKSLPHLVSVPLSETLTTGGACLLLTRQVTQSPGSSQYRSREGQMNTNCSPVLILLLFRRLTRWLDATNMPTFLR